ncbi:hypothetical protein WJX77_001040 [Trebouxia sp. C0004]
MRDQVLYIKLGHKHTQHLYLARCSRPGIFPLKARLSQCEVLWTVHVTPCPRSKQDGSFLQACTGVTCSFSHKHSL